jgi:hypothetical protein
MTFGWDGRIGWGARKDIAFHACGHAVARGRTRQGLGMDWSRILACVTGTVDQELLYAGQVQPYSELKCLDP